VVRDARRCELVYTRSTGHALLFSGGPWRCVMYLFSLFFLFTLTPPLFATKRYLVPKVWWKPIPSLFLPSLSLLLSLFWFFLDIFPHHVSSPPTPLFPLFDSSPPPRAFLGVFLLIFYFPISPSLFRLGQQGAFPTPLDMREMGAQFARAVGTPFGRAEPFSFQTGFALYFSLFCFVCLHSRPPSPLTLPSLFTYHTWSLYPFGIRSPISFYAGALGLFFLPEPPTISLPFLFLTFSLFLNRTHSGLTFPTCCSGHLPVQHYSPLHFDY
jgi:hypothetical protein